MARSGLFRLRDRGLKILALLGGIFFWFYFATRPAIERPFQAGIHYVNVPENFELNPDQVDKVSLIVRGPQEQLDQLGNQPLNVNVDFSTVIRPGEHTFQITPESLKLGPALNLVKAVPSQLRLMVESRVRRDVPVQPRFVGTFQPGYFLESYTVSPRQLAIVGPESRMLLIDQVTTDPIDLSEVVGSTSVRVTASIADPQIRFDGASSVTVEVQVRKRQGES